MKKLLLKTQGVSALVVDDNEVNLMIAKNVLEQYGIDVDPVQSGKEALARIMENDYDIVIMDYVMPDMDGFDTTKRIRSLNRKKASVPVVAYTSNHPDEVLDRFSEVGVEDVLVKPVQFPELTRILLKYISPSKLPDANEIREQMESYESEPESIRTEQKTELQKQLERVDDLDYHTGMHYAMNNEENYLRVLTAGCKIIQDSNQHFKYYLKRMQEPVHSKIAVRKSEIHGEYDKKAAHIDAHSMKGIFASIGMDALSHASANLEQMTDEHSSDEDFPEYLSEYVGWLNNVYESLSLALCNYQKIKSSEEQPEEDVIIPLPLEEYKELLEATRRYVTCFEIDSIRDGLQQLYRASVKAETRNKLQEAMRAADVFDYSGVSAILNKL